MNETIGIGENGFDCSGMPPWKLEIMHQCYRWLLEIQDERILMSSSEEEPDMYSFFEQLCILKSEFRKNSRQSHETFSRFSEHLEGFKALLDSLTQRVERINQAQVFQKPSLGKGCCSRWLN
jgi:hypothetical protein